MSSAQERTIVSFRQHLVEAVTEFVGECGWSQAGLPESIGELLVGLARTREEGKRLFPVVFLTRDLGRLLQTTGGLDALEIGSGPLEPATVQRALKLCAPLGEGRSWVVFLRLDGGLVRFGVFRAPASPIEATALERLRRSEDLAHASLGIVQLAESVLELRAHRGLYRHVYLSGAAREDRLSIDIVRTFIEALVVDAPEEIARGLRNLYYRVLMDVIQNWHGALATVVRRGAPFPKAFCDGVELQQPLRLSEMIATLTRARTPEARLTEMDELAAAMNLIRGMLASDGVVVFSSAGELLGYNVFVRYDGLSEPGAAGAAMGGARKRAFDVLSQGVRDPGSPLTAVFYRSQDGSVDCTEATGAPASP